MKKINLIFLALLVLLPALSASAETFTLGSCDHKIAGSGGYGSDRAGEIAAAMYVPASRLKTLAGNSITRIDVGLISRINVREMTVWVREDLRGDNLATGFLERGSLGWNEITLSTPYEVAPDSPGLYIGFSYNNSGSSHPVSFVGNAGDYSSWLLTEKGGEWQEMTEKGALSIEAVVSGDHLPLYDLTLLSAGITPNPSAGDECYTVRGRVTNMAMRTVSGFYIQAEQEGAVLGESRVSQEVLPGATMDFTTTLTVDSRLEGEVMISVSSLFDGADVNMADNMLPAKVAFARNVLLEEFTTESCPNCPEGARMVHDALEANAMYGGRVIPVCHHAGFGTDWLTRDCDVDLLWFYNLNGQSFAPAAMFDRQPVFRRGLQMDREEPIVALRSQKDVEECIATCLEIPAHAMLGIRVGEVKTDGDIQTVEVEVMMLTDGEFSLSDPHLTFYVVEDNIRAVRQQGAEGSFVHQHVIRFDNGSWGEPVVLEDGTFTKTFTVELEPEWKKEELSFVAFVAERDTESVNHNMVENTASSPLYASENVMADTVSGYAAVEIGRYDIMGRRISAPSGGIDIVIYSDGSVKKQISK